RGCPVRRLWLRLGRALLFREEPSGDVQAPGLQPAGRLGDVPRRADGEASLLTRTFARVGWPGKDRTWRANTATRSGSTLCVERLLGDILLDPLRERVQELLQEVARRVVYQRTARVEELGGFANVGLGLRHRRHVEEYQRLPQMVVRAERANRSGRNADDRPGLAAPCAVSVRARADVDRVLEHAGHAAVVLGR